MILLDLIPKRRPASEETLPEYAEQAEVPPKSKARSCMGLVKQVAHLILVSALSIVLLELLRYAHSRHYMHEATAGFDLPPVPDQLLPDGQEKHDGTIIGCLQPHDWFQSTQDMPSDLQNPINFASDYISTAQTSLQLPRSRGLFFLSRRPQIHGTLVVETAESATDEIQVDILARYSDHSAAFESFSVCHMRKASGEEGIAFYNTRSAWRQLLHKEAEVTISVKLPSSSAGRSWHLPHLQTDLPYFKHRFLEFDPSVTLGSLTITAARASVDVQTMRLESGVIATSHAPISGAFDVSNSLSLMTSNADIIANIRLSNDRRLHSTMLSMETSRGDVTSNVSLVTPEHIDSPRLPNDLTSPDPIYRFNVSARTDDGALRLSFPRSDLGAELHAYVQNVGGSTDLALHPQFEGSFVGWGGNVTVREDVEDPAHLGRRREHWQSPPSGERGIVTGAVGWGALPESQTTGSARMLAMDNARLLI